MKLVVGATGELGGMITRRLLARGTDVRILARPGSPYKPLCEAGAKPVFGDLKESASLEEACAGIEVLITTATAARRMPPDTVETVDLKGNHDLIDAAEAAGVEQFVFVSAFGADPNHIVPLMHAKAISEEHLRSSRMRYTILQPDIFMEVWIPMIVGMPVAAGREVALVGEADHRHSFVSIEDVADYALAVVGHPAAHHSSLQIGGPDPLSWTDVVRTYERVLGRTIPVRSVGPGEPIEGLPEPVVQMAAMFEAYESVLSMSETSRTFGVRPTPLEDVLRQQLRAAA